MPKKSLDVLILFILVIAQVEIITLADNVLPERLTDVQRLVEGWWPAWSLARLDHPQTDPVTMMVIVGAFGALAFYFIVDMLADSISENTSDKIKLLLIYSIIGLLIFAKTILLINLRHQSVPWSYSHDGGVIQTEVTIDYFFKGLNPYVEDYVDTPMAEWGINEYRTALYHYPYLPWTFVFSAPFYSLSHVWLGWYDQRMVYLLLFGLTLLITQSLIVQAQHKRLALMMLGLNPILGVDIIFGVNDPFVFFWIILGVWFLFRGFQTKNTLLASAALGLACASKPTAWFLAPFWLLYLLHDCWGDTLIPPITAWYAHLRMVLKRGWTLPVVALALLGPWFIWNPWAMYDDVWRWAAGLGETGYQIWGWGGSNLVLAFGLIENRFEYWPFIVPQAIIGVPLLIFLLYRQVRHNTVATMMYNYVIFLFIFFYLSRFMQPNYLGFLGGFLVLAYYLSTQKGESYENQIT